MAIMAMVAMAMAVQADLIDGGMTTAQNGVQWADSKINLGWGKATSMVMDGNTASFYPTTNGYTQTGMGQLFTESTLSGAVKIKFDLDYAVSAGTAANVTFGVALIGFKFNTGFSAPLTGTTDYLRLDTMNPLTPSGQVTAYNLYSGGLNNVDLGLFPDQTNSPSLVLASKGQGQQSASGTYYIDANIGTPGTTYDFYALMFTSRYGYSDVANDHLLLDNVSLVPEPATVGMLGLGALITLMVRRIRA